MGLFGDRPGWDEALMDKAPRCRDVVEEDREERAVDSWLGAVAHAFMGLFVWCGLYKATHKPLSFTAGWKLLLDKHERSEDKQLSGGTKVRSHLLESIGAC